METSYSNEASRSQQRTTGPELEAARSLAVDSKLVVVRIVESVTRRAMSRSIAGIIIAVTLMPLLVLELMCLLRLVGAQLRTIAIHITFLLLVIPQAVPFRPLMLPF